MDGEVSSPAGMWLPAGSPSLRSNWGSPMAEPQDHLYVSARSILEPAHTYLGDSAGRDMDTESMGSASSVQAAPDMDGGHRQQTPIRYHGQTQPGYLADSPELLDSSATSTIIRARKLLQLCDERHGRHTTPSSPQRSLGRLNHSVPPSVQYKEVHDTVHTKLREVEANVYQGLADIRSTVSHASIQIRTALADADRLHEVERV